MIRAQINGERFEFPDDITILAAARSAGAELPTLCHDERLEPCGACRLCLVHLKGKTQPVASCQTKLVDGMEIETTTPALEKARRTNLLMLARSYPAGAAAAEPEKPFHRLLAEYSIAETDFQNPPAAALRDETHPYLSIDLARCVDCYRCVRFCDEVQGQFVWRVAGRGQQTRLFWSGGETFAESPCVSCGGCVDACPTGALEDRSVIKHGRPTEWTKSVCPYCGTGCELEIGTREDRIVQIKPALKSPVNRGHLCVKGRYAFDFVDARDRITEPLIRFGRDWTVVGWDEAIDYAAGELRRIIGQYGRESVGLLGSARATNEENYVAQKFVRVALGTNNVDCCARVCHTPTAAAMKMMLGTGAATNSFADIESARAFLICGANPTENHPVVGARIKQAVRAGARLIVVDPRRTELARYADVHLPLRPGTNILLFNALAHVIVEEELYDRRFVAERVADFDEFRSFIGAYDPEKVAPQCRVAAEDIRRAARIFATAKPAMSFHGLGMTEHTQGTEGVMTIVNLALLTGNFGVRGAGVNPLRGQNNVQGSAHMGCDPGVLTGGIGLDEGREHFEKIWRVPIPAAKGLNQLQMTDAARAGKLKALWAIGYDVYLSNANSHRTEESLDRIELVIVQDLFLNETAKRFGRVFFPAASSYEKTGTFMNAERRISLLRPAVSPRGSAKTDWEIVCRMARALGFGEHFDFGSAEEIWDEIRRVWPNAAGITYPRLENGGLQWNCPDESHPGTEMLHERSFAKEPRAALRRIDYRPTKEKTSEEFPLLLTTGRTLSQFNAGTMTARTPNRELRPSDLLDVSPEDAARLALADGEIVLLKSRYGEVRIPLRINSAVKAGEVFATFHSPEIFLNQITSPYRDRFVQAPEFKVTAVAIEKIAE